MTPDRVRHLLAVLERSLGLPIPELPWNGGYGEPYGALCPDYGPHVEELRCNACGATWAGVAGDACGWCVDRLERQQEHQAELLLSAPDVWPDDEQYNNRMRGWAKRMTVGVKAGLITERQARRAWHKALKGAA